MNKYLINTILLVSLLIVQSNSACINQCEYQICKFQKTKEQELHCLKVYYDSYDCAKAVCPDLDLKCMIDKSLDKCAKNPDAKQFYYCLYACFERGVCISSKQNQQNFLSSSFDSENQNHTSENNFIKHDHSKQNHNSQIGIKNQNQKIKGINHNNQ